MSIVESAVENDLNLSKDLTASTFKLKRLAPYAKFQRLHKPKIQRNAKNPRHWSVFFLTSDGDCFQNARKSAENYRFDLKVGTEILIPIVSKSPSLHGAADGSRTDRFFKNPLYHSFNSALRMYCVANHVIFTSKKEARRLEVVDLPNRHDDP